MPNKPIINIQVDSEPFQRFKRLFDDYAKNVKATNAEWAAMAANSNTTLAPIAAYADAAAQAHNRLTIAIRGSGHAMSSLYGHAERFAKTVESITKTFVKWGSISAAGGLFGLGELASGITSQSRTARGMGVSIGQQSAFRVNQTPVLSSPDTVLSNVAQARQDYSKWWALQSLGVNPMTAQNESPFDLSMELEGRARRLWQQHPNVQWAEARGLTQFFSIADLRNLGSMSDKNFAAMQAHTRRDVTSLQPGAQQVAEWTAFSVQLHRAGAEIDKVLVGGLSDLAIPLKKLSGAVVDAMGSFFKSGEARTAIDELAKGITDFSKFIGSPQFKTDVSTFVTDFELVSQKIANGLKLLGLIPDDKKGGGFKSTAEIAGGAAAGAAVGGLPGAVVGGAVGAGTALAPKTWQELGEKNRAQSLWWGRLPQWWNGTGGAGATETEKQAFLRSVEIRNKLPSGLLAAVRAQESSNGKNIYNPKSGALGDFQFLPATAKQWGVDPLNFYSAGSGAGKYLASLLSKYHGDEDKALAAYGGAKDLDKEIARYGADWRKHISPAAEKYIEQVEGKQREGQIDRLIRVTKAQKRATVNVRVDNNTAAQIAIQANNAAPQ